VDWIKKLVGMVGKDKLDKLRSLAKSPKAAMDMAMGIAGGLLARVPGGQKWACHLANAIIQYATPNPVTLPCEQYARVRVPRRMITAAWPDMEPGQDYVAQVARMLRQLGVDIEQVARGRLDGEVAKLRRSPRAGGQRNKAILDLANQLIEEQGRDKTVRLERPTRIEPSFARVRVPRSMLKAVEIISVKGFGKSVVVSDGDKEYSLDTDEFRRTSLKNVAEGPLY
jgi:hypothetical protein